MKETIDKNLVKGVEITPSMIREWLDRDLNALLSLMYAIQQSDVIKTTVVNWLYESHVASKVNDAAEEYKKRKEVNNVHG